VLPYVVNIEIFAVFYLFMRSFSSRDILCFTSKFGVGHGARV